MIRMFTSRTISNAIWLLAIVAIGIVSSRAAQAEPGYSSWFNYEESVERAWKFTEIPGDPMQVMVTRKHADPNSERHNIVVLYPKKSSAYDVAISKVLDVFHEKNINAQMRIVNFARDDDAGKRVLDMIEEGEYELVFSMGSASTVWLWKHYQGGKVPVVSVCSKDPVLLGQASDYESGSGTNFAFTSLNMPIEVQVAYLLELKPNLKNLGVLVDSQNISAMETQAKPIADYLRKRGIQVLDVVVKNSEQAKSELEVLVRESVATMRKNDPTLDNSVFWITGSTSVFREIHTINANSDRVPVLSVVPEVVQAGEDSAVLSIGISFKSNAHLAAIYGIDVLHGRMEVGELSVGIVSPPDISINFRKAREIGLEIPFSFFESASFVYDYEGRIVRQDGRPVQATN